LPLSVPYCSVRIQYSGPPGSVIAVVSGTEARGDLAIDSRVANKGNGWAGSGANPWHLDEETESIQFLTNLGDQMVQIGYVVTAGGVHYYLGELKLNPHETRAIDIRQLCDAQEADFKGNKIPAGSDGRRSVLPLAGRRSLRPHSTAGRFSLGRRAALGYVLV
jgi:hypothetical protein